MLTCECKNSSFLIQGKLKLIQIFVVGKLFSISPTSQLEKNEKIIGNDKKIKKK